MSGSRVVFDGLWRCLCPSIDANVAARLLSSPALPRASLATSHRKRSITAPRQLAVRTQCRRHATAATSVLRSEGRLGTSTSDVEPQDDANRAESQHNGPSSFDTGPNPNEQLRSAPLPAVYDALQLLRGQPKSFDKVATIITHLVRDRDVELSPILYEHLVVAMADVQGSAAMLGQLFAEMRQLQLNPTTAICHAALAVCPPGMTRGKHCTDLTPGPCCTPRLPGTKRGPHCHETGVD